MIEKNYLEVFYNNKGTLYNKAITAIILYIPHNIISITVHKIYKNKSTTMHKM